jgi:hypothetical protein
MIRAGRSFGYDILSAKSGRFYSVPKNARLAIASVVDARGSKRRRCVRRQPDAEALGNQAAAIPSAVGATHLPSIRLHFTHSIRREIANCPDDIRRLRQNRVLQRRVIRAERVRRGNAPHRSV